MRELIPVVVPDVTLPVFILWEFMLVFILWCFIRVLVAPGPTLPSLDAPGAGWVCAGATDVIPTSEATTRAESASLDSMGKLLLNVGDAGFRTYDAGVGSRPVAQIGRPLRTIGWRPQ